MLMPSWQNSARSHRGCPTASTSSAPVPFRRPHQFTRSSSRYSTKYLKKISKNKSMSEIKTLADQLRSRMAQPDTPPVEQPVSRKKSPKAAVVPQIVELLRAYELNDHKSMVHVRFDAKTAQVLHNFKMATGVEVTRL